METHHPWQSGPTELLSYAIEHLHRSSDFDQRIAYLLLDVGVETLLKTFLQLPQEVTGTQMSHEKRNKAASGNFHEVVLGAKAAAGQRLHGINLSHVEFYHEIRNKLYHQGNGITVPTDQSKGYADIAVQLLKRLLGVDLQPQLLRPVQEQQAQLQRTQLAEQALQAQQHLRNELSFLDTELRLTIERIEPAFLMPSFEQRFDAWKDSVDLETLRPSWPKLDATGLAHSGSELSADVLASLPTPLREFVNTRRLEPIFITYFSLARGLGEFLLAVALALQLVPEPSGDAYGHALTLLRMDPLHPTTLEIPFGLDPNQALYELSNQCKDTSDEIRAIRLEIASSTHV